MEALIDAQTELTGRIARTYENLKKSGAAKITRPAIVATLRLLDAKWEKMEELHEKLRARFGEELKKHEYYLNDAFGQAEQIYIQQRAALLELDEALSASKVEGRSGASETQPPPRTTLPRIQLPTFTGRYDDWPSFRDLFVSLIVKDSTISDVTRLYYLKASLKGEAESVIRSLPTTSDNFDRAWQMLKDYYENTRILVRSFYATYTALPKIKGESSATALRKLFLCMTSTVGSLESIGRPISSSEDLFVFLTTERLDPQSRLEWENHISKSTKPPTYEELRQFLERRLHTLEAVQPPKPEPSKTAGKKDEQSTLAHVAQKQEAGKGRCALCQKDHYLMVCDAYKAKSAGDRKRVVEKHKLCLNCLGKHKTSECASKRTCPVCGLRHHSSLHDTYRTSQGELEPVKASHNVAHRPLDGRLAVLLATARIRVADRAGAFLDARALIDQGSETSIITETLAQRHRLSRQRAAVAVFGVGGQQTGVARGQDAHNHPQERRSCDERVRNRPPETHGLRGRDEHGGERVAHLQGLELADPDFLAPGDIDVLLGADVYAAILRSGVRKGGSREPVAQQISLGWIVSGAVDSITSHTAAATHQCTVDEPLSSLVRRFWEQEELQATPVPLTEEEQVCEDLFVSTHTRTSYGRYIVRLPLASKLPDLSGTKAAAIKMLTHMERRLVRNANLRTLYEDFMRQYEQLGHMTRVDPPKGAEERTCYLPHHGVMKEASSTTKLRVVFNGSWSLASGESLNKNLLTGPNLLPPLADVIIRWRRHRYVFAADIEKMYRQVLVHPEDRDLQRIVWRTNREDAIQAYQLNTVTYGLACAPYLAIRALRQLAEDEELRFPLGAAILRRDVYVDDILSGASTMTGAAEALRDLRSICMAGGFPVRKWVSNEASLLSGLPEEDCSLPSSRTWLPGQSHSTLGLEWHPGTDSFGVTVRPTEWMPVTKRTILSQTARLFDPLGWLAPVVVSAKITIQSIWLQGLDWDTPLSEADTTRWRVSD